MLSTAQANSQGGLKAPCGKERDLIASADVSGPPASVNPFVLNRSLALTPPAGAAWRPDAPLKISVASLRSVVLLTDFTHDL